jgi:PEP-CTERM motif
MHRKLAVILTLLSFLQPLRGEISTPSMLSKKIKVTFHTFDSLTSILAATVLGSGVLRESGISTTAAWTRIQTSEPISVRADTTYAFKVVGKDPGGSTGWNNYSAAASNVYIGGNFLTISTNGNVGKNNSDLAFRVSSVPEPSSILLVLVGLSLAAIRRTRRASQIQSATLFSYLPEVSTLLRERSLSSLIGFRAF